MMGFCSEHLMKGATAQHNFPPRSTENPILCYISPTLQWAFGHIVLSTQFVNHSDKATAYSWRRERLT